MVLKGCLATKVLRSKVLATEGALVIIVQAGDKRSWANKIVPRP